MCEWERAKVNCTQRSVKKEKFRTKKNTNITQAETLQNSMSFSTSWTITIRIGNLPFSKFCHSLSLFLSFSLFLFQCIQFPYIQIFYTFHRFFSFCCCCCCSSCVQKEHCVCAICTGTHLYITFEWWKWWETGFFFVSSVLRFFVSIISFFRQTTHINAVQW